MNGLSSDNAKACEELGRRIREEEARASEAFLTIGECFTEAKARLGEHETWKSWVESQTSFSVRHANRLIQVAHFCRTSQLAPATSASLREVLRAMDGVKKAEEAAAVIEEVTERFEERDTRVPSNEGEIRDPAGITGSTLQRGAEDLARLDGLGALTSSNSQEHYTPPRLTDAGRFVLGEIDLDPASCAEANERVGAKVFYTKEDDGLTKPWAGNVFLNWPGGIDEMRRSVAKKFSDKLLDGFEQRAITNAFVVIFKWMHSEPWLKQLLAIQPDFCLLSDRCEFVLPGGEIQAGMPFCSGVLLLSDDNEMRVRFRNRMSNYGIVVDGGTITLPNVDTIDVMARGAQ